MRYRHLFFDLDHTLWDFDANAKIAMKEVYDEFQLIQKNIPVFENFFTIYLKHNAQLWDRYHKGFISAEDLKWKRMQRTLLDFKVGDDDLAKQMGVKFLDILPTKNGLFDYTIEILEYLVNKKYQLHLITNGFEKTQWSKINNSKLAKYFTHVITSETSNAIKPAKEIFEYAVKLANAELSESIMIGDNPDADIQGAINAGMDCIFVNHTNAVSPVTCTFMISHLKQLENIL